MQVTIRTSGSSQATSLFRSSNGLTRHPLRSASRGVVQAAHPSRRGPQAAAAWTSAATAPQAQAPRHHALAFVALTAALLASSSQPAAAASILDTLDLPPAASALQRPPPASEAAASPATTAAPALLAAPPASAAAAEAGQAESTSPSAPAAPSPASPDVEYISEYLGTPPPAPEPEAAASPSITVVNSAEGSMTMVVGGEEGLTAIDKQLLRLNKRQQAQNRAPADFPSFVRGGFDVKVLVSDGYQMAPNGLIFKEFEAGSGEMPQDGQQVIFQYTAYNESGSLIDSSYRQAKPAEVRMGVKGLIPGFEEGIKMMKVGAKRRIVVPPALGPPVGPSTFFSAKQSEVFDVELMGIKSCSRRQVMMFSDVVCE